MAISEKAFAKAAQEERAGEGHRSTIAHDDLLISAALCALLDDQPGGLSQSEFVQSPDPLSGLSDTFYY